MRFAPIPALDVVRSRWPVHDVWASPTASPAARATVLRIWRQDFAVFHASMDAIEDAAFAALRAGEPFESICAAVAEHMTEEAAAAEAGSLLLRWIDDGLIAGTV